MADNAMPMSDNDTSADMQAGGNEPADSENSAMPMSKANNSASNEPPDGLPQWIANMLADSSQKESKKDAKKNKDMDMDPPESGESMGMGGP